MIGARSLHIIEQSGRHLAAVISDMLDLSRIQSGTLDLHLAVCAAGDLGVASIAALREEAQRKQQQVDFIINPPDLQVRVDVRRFEQVLVNLLANAIKFTCRRQTRVDDRGERYLGCIHRMGRGHWHRARRCCTAVSTVYAGR